MTPGKNIPNRNMNKLVLGTVQFGLDYGIVNKLGKPSLEDSLKMLAFAFQNGIRTFDTAFAYGDAEEILGKFVVDNKLAGKVKIISKLKPNIFEGRSPEVSKYKIIKWEIEKSLNKLHIKSLDGYLLHTPAYIYDKKIVEALKQCKKEGLISNFGVSIYDAKDALYAVKDARVDYIQIPYSVFDQRLDKTDFFKIAKKNNVKIFARSAFLQGLILMKNSMIPKHLSEAKKYLNTFDKIIGKHGFTRIQTAMLFSYSNSNIDSLVFGVDNVSQLKQNIGIANRAVDFEKCRAELEARFIPIKKSIIFPSLWSKKI